MKEKILYLLIKIFVRETVIFDVDTYPNYEDLVDFGYLIINTYHGSFMFKVKEDYNNVIGCDEGWLLRNRFFTVELIPYRDNVTVPRKNYKDKIMLVVKVGSFAFSKKTIISMLVNIYLKEIWKQDLSKIRNFNTK